MRAFGRHRRGEPEPQGSPCDVCGFRCEGDQTVFIVPREFARSKYAPTGDGLAMAHVACSHTMYRGRFDALKDWVEDGLPHGEIMRLLALWPWASEEEKAHG